MSSPEIIEIDCEESPNLEDQQVDNNWEPYWWEENPPSAESVETLPYSDSENPELLTSTQKEEALRRTLKEKESRSSKEERMAAVAKQKSLKPEEMIKQLKVLIDSELLSCEYGSKILLTLQEAGIKFKVDSSNFKMSVRFSKEEELDFLILFQLWSQVVNLVAAEKFSDYLINIKSGTAEKKITIVILGFEKYQKHLNNKVNEHLRGKPSKKTKEKDLENAPVIKVDDLNMELIKLQFLYKINHRFLENSEDVAAFVSQFIKSISQIDYKQQKYEKDMNLQWWAYEDNKSSVKVDKQGHGLLSLWQQQLMQFPLSGLEIAQAIVEKYKSPQMLLQAYQEIGDPIKCQLLLQDIPVRRNAGILASVRKVGPELSKKIYFFFCSGASGDEV